MLDFLRVTSQQIKEGEWEVYPIFVIKRSKDLMIRGSDFYAVWVEERGLWSADEEDVINMVDAELRNEYNKVEKRHPEDKITVKWMWNARSGSIDAWHKYCQRQCRDNYQMLDERVIFANEEIKKSDYATKKLNYPIEEGDISAYDSLMSVLYSPEERKKLEWAIGAIVTGDSKNIQKFEVLYGPPGSGKSTVLNLIQKLFDGYYSVFDAKALGNPNNAFALESFKQNPLVAIQHDGDLSRIEDNTRLNSLVSHELMTVNEKFKSAYSNRFRSFLFMGTNKPVRISDAKSGIIRRLIDVTPTGNKVPVRKYNEAVKKMDFELGAIAWHCKQIYLEDPEYYDDYVPINMMGASNDFFNFVEDSFYVFNRENCTTLKTAWEMYNRYCDEARVSYPYPKRQFKEELKNYFKNYEERHQNEDGSMIQGYYYNFDGNKFNVTIVKDEGRKAEKDHPAEKNWIELTEQHSILDDILADCPAQYATPDDKPMSKWTNVTTKLRDLDSHRLHYVKLPDAHHIVIDFDLKDESGFKSFEKNLVAASKWPKTYAETSKSGKGIHLHYIYSGDPTKLSRIYDDNIEVKVYTGNASLRRMLTKCNDLPIATISSGLPLKGDDKMLDMNVVTTEKGIRTTIKRNLAKEIHPNTTPSIQHIKHILDKAYAQGVHYDVTDLRPDIQAFALSSTHQANACISLVNEMHFKSDEPAETVPWEEAPIAFYDVEVFPNLFLVNYKVAGDGKKVIRMINPKPAEIEQMITHYRLVGFNNRDYDNHMIYACMIGYTPEQIYELSRKIIVDKSPNAKFGEAYNLSYTDIYDFAKKKQSLKKWEIALGIHHQELGLPWDQPVPEDLWPKVAEYCDNDVLATEALFNYEKIQDDFHARCSLAKISNGTPNDTNNQLTGKLIFQGDKNPQKEFVYTNFATGMSYKMGDSVGVYHEWNHFPGYEFVNGKSTYRGDILGEGGKVYADYGIWYNLKTFDVASMHPHSIIALNLFGDRYTARFKELVDARIAIKHRDKAALQTLFGGAFAEYADASDDELKNLAGALKIVINSVYGLTAAHFTNLFRDERNVDNIVAKRGALFMTELKHQLEQKGVHVVHIKTDSIKIDNPSPETEAFIIEFGKKYGYDFEVESEYKKMCLVNDAVYIAYTKDNKWTATGTQFAVPYVFKTLFSKEPIEFKDLCETKNVTAGDIFLDMNEGYPEVANLEKEAAKIKKAGKEIPKELLDDIAKGHNLKFVGRVGQFCPIKEGCGGGILYRVQNGKNYAVTGTTGYRWLESEMVRAFKKEDCIDKRYYQKLVDDAIEAINKYGDANCFMCVDGNCDSDIIA